MASNVNEVDEIKQWLASQPEIQELSDEEIKIFLHSCYNKVDDTKNCIQVYHSSRAELTEIFTDRDPTGAQVQDFLKCFQIMFPDEKTDENYSVIIIRANNPAPELFDTASFYKVYFMTIEALFLENPFCEGVQLVFDVAGFSFSHLRRMNFGLMRKCSKYLEEGMPIRTKGVHIINFSSIVMKVIQIIRTFSKTDRSDISFFHSASNIETLYEYIPQRCLPEEYGGTLGSSKELNEKNLQRLIKHRDFFLGKNETKHAENLSQSGQSSEDSFSLEKLNID